MKELSQAVNGALADSEEVQDAIKSIEDEEYQVDMLFALFTRILRRKEKDDPLQLGGPAVPSEAFDDDFMKGARVKWSSEKN